MRLSVPSFKMKTKRNKVPWSVSAAVWETKAQRATKSKLPLYGFLLAGLLANLSQFGEGARAGVGGQFATSRMVA